MICHSAGRILSSACIIPFVPLVVEITCLSFEGRFLERIGETSRGSTKQICCLLFHGWKEGGQAEAVALRSFNPSLCVRLYNFSFDMVDKLANASALKSSCGMLPSCLHLV